MYVEVKKKSGGKYEVTPDVTISSSVTVYCWTDENDYYYTYTTTETPVVGTQDHFGNIDRPGGLVTAVRTDGDYPYEIQVEGESGWFHRYPDYDETLSNT